MKMQSKKEIRAYIKDKKNQMSFEDITAKSQRIQDKLLCMREYVSAEDIYIYVNYNQEVITTDIIETSLSAGKNVYVPKVYGPVIQFHKIHSLTKDLIKGAYGIPEPVTEYTDEERDGLLVMPGLAFDKTMKRIGYGGGFYDKYLSLSNSHYKIALAYEFQMFNEIVCESFDYAVDMIITENNIYKRG